MMIRKFIPIRLVASESPVGRSQIARREPGRTIATGTIAVSPAKIEFALPRKATSEIQRTVDLYTQGYQQAVERRKKLQDIDAVLRTVRKYAGQLPVDFVVENDLPAALIVEDEGSKHPRLQLDVTWPGKTDSPYAELFGGITLLGTLLMLNKGVRQREALHRLFDLYDIVSESDREHLQEFLRGPVVDSGNALANCLVGLRDAKMAKASQGITIYDLEDISTETLFVLGPKLDELRFAETGKALMKAVRDCAGKHIGDREFLKPRDDESPRAYADRVFSQIEGTLKWRDTWVTWAIGQDRFDLPYPQDEVIQVLDTEYDDIDEQRATVNELISKNFDYFVEGNNIKRLAEWAYENGMKLVSGRLSRAFGNQAHLLATSKYLEQKEQLAPLAEKLEKASREQPDLHVAATRLLHLVQEQKQTSYARIVGALNNFEETLVKYQSETSKKILQDADEASRRILSKTSAKRARERLTAEVSRIEKLFELSSQFREQLGECPKRAAAYVMQLQRLHPGEAINMGMANAFREVHPGKEEDLKDLLRQGGHYTYCSPGPGKFKENNQVQDTHWITKVHDWVEAIPLFIKERVISRDVKVGGELTTVESIETEVDQEAMEAFFRFHAQFWAQNLNEVMDSERVGLARMLLAENDPQLAKAVRRLMDEQPALGRDEATRQILKNQPKLVETIVQLAALVDASEDALLEEIHRTVEVNAIARRAALRNVVCETRRSDKHNLVGLVLEAASGKRKFAAAVNEIYGQHAKKLGPTYKRLEPIALTRTRPVPSLHILTTESAGMTEGYVQTWVEEEIALYNVIKAKGLESEVVKEEKLFRDRIQAVAGKVIDEFGMRVVVEEVMADQRCSEEVAVSIVIAGYKPVADQVSRLAVLLEAGGDPEATIDTRPIRDIARVRECLEKHGDELQALAVPQVMENNGRAFEQRMEEIAHKHPEFTASELQLATIQSEKDYRDELESIMLMEARRIVLNELAEAHPELDLHARVRTYLRMHTQLGRSTARKQVVARHQLNALTNHPKYYYQATGGNKRYNLLYTPSRVNLGHRERDSVVKWRQWVGGADAAAAQAGFDFYSLVNEGGVEERPALAYAEIQKTSENGLCVTHYAGSNALGLLCMAVLEGDVQDMADQMNLREDRLVPPAGEGYGGYCVPKDGLFLAFVLSLTNEVKLRQMGIPDHLHKGVMELAKHTLLHRTDFETDLDWQRWAAEKLLKYEELQKHFQLRDDVLVFHITKIARALENLGRPWHETASGSVLIANLAADWSVEKMIVNAEQVNRFTVFYKAWAIYDALRQARDKHPLCPRDDEARINISAEYKPVQDVRFSTGMRLFEIFAKTGDHLHYALDEEGQNLVHLMFEGFDPDTEHPIGKRMVRQILHTLRISEDDRETIERLKTAFPPHRPPADLVVTSVTLSSTQDILFYTSDSRLDEIANTVQVQIGDYGLTEEQIRANAEVYGGNLRKWAGISHLPKNQIDSLIERVGGGIHALVLKLRGPGRDYEKDIQGVDVFNTGIPFKQLLRLVQDPPKLAALMLQGNPNSALVVADGCAGREPRSLTDYDVKAFFAACERFGRRGTYIGMGLGRHNIERLEESMRVWRSRGQRLFDAVAVVCNASAKEKNAAIARALELYEEIQRTIVEEDEAGKALRQEEKLRRYKKWLPRDTYMSQALVKVAAGLPLARLDAGIWLAGLGGTFVVMGERELKINAMLAQWDTGIEAIAQSKPVTAATRAVPFTEEEIRTIRKVLIRPAFEPDIARFTQQKLVESSSKAVEVAAVEALERRRALRVRAEKAKAMSDREDGFREVFEAKSGRKWQDYENAAQGLMDQILKQVEAFDLKASDAISVRTEIYRNFGRLIACTRNSIVALAREILKGKSEENARLCKSIEEHAATIYMGREIVLENWKMLAGGYEDMGGLARLAQVASSDRNKLDAVARIMELFYVTFALGQTLQFAVDDPNEIDSRIFYKNLTDFFAETINDHWYHYAPWVFFRGTGFSHLSAEEIYALSVKHHLWLYRYIRRVLIACTNLRHLPTADVDALLGKMTPKSVSPGIGAGAESDIELRWRAYNQLREISFMHSDGFSTPVVFQEFDVDLIEADKRVNVCFLYPVGRTHVSRALREGPTLNRLLQAERRMGANLMITRSGHVDRMNGANRKVLTITDAHLYIDRETYIRALQRLKGFTGSQAESAADEAERDGRLTAKGIRIAARFTRNGKPAKVVVGAMIPFHGLPMYESGITEAIGLPATVQSLVFSDITYDKSLYPEIYTQSSGVELPPEMDWKQEYGSGKQPAEVKRLMLEGIPGNGYIGMRAFAEQHPIVLIKGAAESGARNLKVFEVQDDTGRISEQGIQDAVGFLYDVSRNQNVVVQTAILTSPEFWAAPKLMKNFVDRQILEWNMPVHRDRLPRSQIFGSLRIVASSSHPDRPYDLAFPIILSSLQVATNVGRGGTLEKLLDEFVQEEYRGQIRSGLEREAPKVMKAMAEYAKKYEKTFREKRGMPIKEDARGVSYAWPPYLMLDYLVSPVFSRPGRLVDIEPVYNERGERVGSHPILQDESGRFVAGIQSWRFIHLEPNVGVGLWDRFNLREEFLEQQASREENRPFNWDNVGTSDRIVLRNFVLSGEQYLHAVMS